MGCSASKAGRFELVELAEPTSRPLESLANDRDAEQMRAGSMSERGGRFYFGQDEPATRAVKLESSEFDLANGVEIGSGGFGAVFATLHVPTGAIVAVKKVRKGKDARSRAEISMEARALTRLQGSPFVVRFYGAMQTSSHHCFVLQLLQGGELYAHLRRTPGKRFSEAVTRFYAAELVTCLEAVHARGMAYRDLKPENLCLDADGHLCLVDFGFCCQVDDRGIAHGHVGTPYFMSPEILDPKSKDHGYPAQAVDWWALGCALWEMMAGKHPFGNPGMTKHEVFIRITSGRSSPPLSLSSNARSLLAGMLSLDYKARLKSAEAIKRHPFFAGVPWLAVAERRVRPPWTPALSSAADTRYFPRAAGQTPPLGSPAAAAAAAASSSSSARQDPHSSASAAPSSGEGAGSSSSRRGSSRHPGRGAKVAAALSGAGGTVGGGTLLAGEPLGGDSVGRTRGHAAAVRRRRLASGDMSGDNAHRRAAAAAAVAAKRTPHGLQSAARSSRALGGGDPDGTRLPPARPAAVSANPALRRHAAPGGGAGGRSRLRAAATTVVAARSLHAKASSGSTGAAAGRAGRADAEALAARQEARRKAGHSRRRL